MCFRFNANNDQSTGAEAHEEKFAISSTPEGLQVVKPTIDNRRFKQEADEFEIAFDDFVPPSCQFYQTPIGNSFPADCGFQAIAWIKAQAEETSSVNMTTVDAFSLRCDFARQLTKEQADQTIVQHIQLGGMLDSQSKGELKSLLEQHGVSSERSTSVVDLLVEKLSMPVIKSILGPPRAWQDLKARASACKPAIQLVLAEELRRVVENRIKEGKQFGRKDNKKKSNGPNKGPIRIDANQVAIPPTVFQQEGGAPVPQVAAHDIHAQTKGIVVLNIEDAIPYFGPREQISNEGLGLLVLEHSDQRLPPAHQVVRFPATCVATQEPMLLAAALFQLGKKQVSRNIPKERSKVDEISTTVIRSLVFRDDFKRVAWEEFCQTPVKHLFAMEPFEDLANGASIDVWDRQFLAKSFKKSKQSEAEMFLVTIRVSTEDGQAILQLSGKDGVFFEPRSENGRQPHQGYRVVWLPKMSLGEIHLARQTAPKPTWVVRNGERFGLRASIDDIAEIHLIHKPEIPFMDGSNVQTYRIEPLPFGTTKQSLMRVFQTWGWEARPLQPQGQTRDHEGVAWSAIAASNPTHWVYTMEHGDVLVSIQTSVKEDASSMAAGAPVASTRTLKHLNEHRQTSSPIPEAMIDPLQSHDPWTQWKPNAPNRASKALSVSQIASIEANVEKKILASITTNPGGEDAVMTSAVDGRVDHLEKQVKQLHETVGKMQHNMQTFQNQQSQHNAQVVNEIGSVKQQVEHQNNSLRSMLDTKLEDQMSRIEALLSKKARTSTE